MAKFSDGFFTREIDSTVVFAYNKKKFTKQEALKRTIEELRCANENLEFEIGTCYVKYGYYNFDEERRQGYYIDFEKTKNSCECWMISVVSKEELHGKEENV